MIKGCNFFGVKNWQTLAVLWVGALSCNKKNFKSRMQLDKPVECASGGDPYSFTKSCIYCFSFWYKFFVRYALRVKKNGQNDLDAGPLEF